MAEVKWIKLSIDVFDNRKIKLIEALPDGDAMVVTWFKLLCLAGNTNDNGDVYFTNEVPYTEEMLATLFNKPLQTVRMALNTFQQFGMLEVIDDIIHISNWEKYQNVEGMDRIREQTRNRVAKHREKKKLECNVTVTQCNATDIEEDIDIDKDIEKESIKKKRFTKPTVDEVRAYCIERNNNIDPQHFVDYYEANGWKVGKNPMKDWKACVRTWERNNTGKKNDPYSAIKEWSMM